MMRILVITSLFTLRVALVADADPEAAKLTQARERPSIFVTATPKDGLRSVEAVRQGIQSGHSKVLWETLLANVDQQLEEPVVSPMQQK